jgi:phasin
MASTPKKNPAAQAAQLAAAELTSPPVIETPAEVVAEVSENFAAPATEMQQSVRAALEKGVLDTRAALAKAKTSADEAVSALETSFNAAREGVIAINTKAIEAFRANTEANFDFMRASIAARSLSDLVALQNEFARKQIETFAGQAKEFGALAQKTALDAFQPIKEQATKSFKLAG